MVLELDTKLCFANKKVSIMLKNIWIEKIKNRELEYTKDGIFIHWTMSRNKKERTNLTCNNMEDSNTRRERRHKMLRTL